ncbi:hypothetical protein [Ulvibacterium sp.]|uniref:hypothetical protein n=1 Tax=Ulvibacterium sp. TaxID=2665914 RepID=UPI003BAB632B
MKRKGLFLATIVFFLAINTSYFWIGNLGIFAILIFGLVFILFFVLLAFLIGQMKSLVKGRHNDKQRIILVGTMVFVLVTSLLFPTGIINFEKFDSESLLIAQREGAANCMTTLKLKENNKFMERNVCFGISETKGDYRIVNDTIYFHNVSLGLHEKEFYEYAIIKKRKNSVSFIGEIVRYESLADTTGNALWIVKNKLEK